MNELYYLNNNVTVLDLGNYKNSHSEEVPFKAFLHEITDYPYFWVRSLKTNNEYELYPEQIGEFIPYVDIISFYGEEMLNKFKQLDK